MVELRRMFAQIGKAYSVKCHSKPDVTWSFRSLRVPEGQIYLDYELVSLLISSSIEWPIEATEQSVVSVTYEATDYFLHITVRDSGNRVWAAGMSGDDSYAIYRLVDLLGGNVGFVSNEGKGSKTLIRIPIKLRRKAVTSSPLVKAPASRMSGEGLSLLVVSGKEPRLWQLRVGSRRK